MRRRRWIATGAIALAFGAVACGGTGDAAGPSATTEGAVTTTLADFSIKVSESEVPAGTVAFDIHNDGPSDHAFAVIRTDLADDALPTKDHLVEVEQLDVATSVDAIAFDADRELTVDLGPGTYVLICTLPGHYESDMHVAFTVV